MTIVVVTGTGTDVGKTMTTAALAACGPARTAVVKPAQTGVAPGEAGDLAEVSRLSGCTDVHEFARYPDPLSPHHAARRVGRPGLDRAETVRRIETLAVERELVIVEGAGGALVPFDDSGWTVLDLALDLDASLVLVTLAGLGTLNHTTLTVRAIAAAAAKPAGIVIGGWPDRAGLAEHCNVEDLSALSAHGTLAGVLPMQASARPTFAEDARGWLAPELGGRFDGPAFTAAISCTLQHQPTAP